jgi:hypothetical protein
MKAKYIQFLIQIVTTFKFLKLLLILNTKIINFQLANVAFNFNDLLFCMWLWS